MLVSAIQPRTSAIIVCASPPSVAPLPFPAPSLQVLRERQAGLPVLQSSFSPGQSQPCFGEWLTYKSCTCVMCTTSCLWGEVYTCEASLVLQMVKNPPAAQETRVWSLDGEDPLVKEMATHSSILVWRIPWTEEPDWLESIWGLKSQTWLRKWTTTTTLLWNHHHDLDHKSVSPYSFLSSICCFHCCMTFVVFLS